VRRSPPLFCTLHPGRSHLTATTVRKSPPPTHPANVRPTGSGGVAQTRAPRVYAPSDLERISSDSSLGDDLTVTGRVTGSTGRAGAGWCGGRSVGRSQPPQTYEEESSQPPPPL